MKKAQIELITILGVVVVIFVIAYYAFLISNQPSNPVPSGVGAEQSLVQDKIEGIISDGALLSVKWMEQQGGSILPIFNNSVSFTRVMVPYWQKCGKTMVPSLDLLTRQLENATYNYILYNLYNQSEMVLGKNVAVDLANTKVTASVLDNKIDLQVSMPTDVQGYALQQPFKVSIGTKFGEIYKFMKAYAEEAARNHYLELFMINSIYFSATKDDNGIQHPELPTFGMLTECGETITRTPQELSSAMDQTIFYTLANVQWWAPFSSGLDCSGCGNATLNCPSGCSQPKNYVINNLNGRTYPQLNPLFMVDDNFGINISTGIYISNPKPVVKANLIFKQFVSSGWCMRPYSASYAFQTPVILKVDDPLTNTPFNIATLVDITDMLPGKCGELPPSQSCTYNPGNINNVNSTCTALEVKVEKCLSDHDSGSVCQALEERLQQECSYGRGAISCTNGGVILPSCGSCSVKMKIATPDGAPVRGAMGYFGSCTFLPSDSNGFVEGDISCGADELDMTYVSVGTTPKTYHRQWCVSPSELNGTVTVYEYPNLKIHFREVNLTTCKASVTSGFVIANTNSTEACGQSITNANVTDGGFCTDEASCEKQLETTIAEENVDFNQLQPGRHNITATMLKFEGQVKNEAGFLQGSFDITSLSRDIYMYVPLYKNAALASSPDYGLSMTNEMISNCSISPVMEVDKA